MNKTKNKGITLIALVITIIILLILAGIAILQLTESGLFENARQAEEKTKNAQEKENSILGEYENAIDQCTSGSYIEDDDDIYVPPTLADGSWDSNKNVHSPKLMAGMKGVYWDTNGKKVTVTAENENNWYDYANKKWANAETEDGSLWVWIPRYEYKITYKDTSDYSLGGTITVNFIQIGTTATTNYKIHPAFEDGSENGKDNNYANGEWDEEIPGFWVAKFAAGYAGGGMNDINNDVTVVDSGETYSGQTAGSNYYGSITSGTTTMKYPVFMGQTYAYNRINIGDSYKLSRNLTKTGNPYGLSSSETDSHQMKNSEWGAVAYLTHSQYGLNGQNLLYINNVNLNNTVSTIYSVTGYAAEQTDSVEGTDAPQNQFTAAPSELGNSISAGTYTSWVWYSTNGQKGSSTQNITGVYDLSGCVWERTSAYIDNTSGADSRNLYGGNLVSETDLKYKTIYPHNSTSDTYANNWTAYRNEQTTTYGYGDAILETSKSGSGNTSWNGDYSYFPYYNVPFFIRGGWCDNSSNAGVFVSNGYNGSANNGFGFRAVLIGQ